MVRTIDLTRSRSISLIFPAVTESIKGNRDKSVIVVIQFLLLESAMDAFRPLMEVID